MNETVASRVAWHRRGPGPTYVGAVSRGPEAVRLSGRDPQSGIDVSLTIPSGQVAISNTRETGKAPAAEGLERSTVEQYELHVRQLQAAIAGTTKLAKINTARCEQVRDDLMNRHKRATARKVLTQAESTSVVHVSCTDYFRGIQAKSSREDPKAPEHHLLGIIEQVVAPGDGVPQRLLSLREVPRAANEEP